MKQTELGKRLERLWQSAGYKSLGDITRATGISIPTWSRIRDGGQLPSPETLRKLAAAINISHCELMKIAGYIDDSSCYKLNGGNIYLSPNERSLISKYRQLDTRGKNAVDTILENQHCYAEPNANNERKKIIYGTAETITIPFYVNEDPADY